MTPVKPALAAQFYFGVMTGGLLGLAAGMSTDRFGLVPAGAVLLILILALGLGVHFQTKAVRSGGL